MNHYPRTAHNETQLVTLYKGSHSTVVRPASAATYAIKTVSIFDNLNIRTAGFRDFIYLQQIDHPNIVKCFDIVVVDDNIKMTMDLAVCDLNCLALENISYLGLKEIAFELVIALAHLHNRGIIHRDIKTPNILCYRDQAKISGFRVVLADFGIAKAYDRLHDAPVSYAYSDFFRPPEIISKLSYDSQADVWALGCVIYAIFNKNHLFPTSDEAKHMDMIYDRVGLTNSGSIYTSKREVKPTKFESLGSDPLLNDLLRKMINPDPSRRISIFETQYHGFFLDLMGIDELIVSSISLEQRVRLLPRGLGDLSPVWIYADDLVDPKIVTQAVEWLIEVKIEFCFSEAQHFFAIELMYQYFSLFPQYPVEEIQLVAISSAYLGSWFIGPEIISSETASLLTERSYSEKQILDMSLKMLVDMKYVIYVSTNYDLIMAKKEIYDKQIIDLATNLLMAAAMAPEIYVGGKLSEACLATAIMKLNPLEIGDLEDYVMNIADLLVRLGHFFEVGNRKKYLKLIDPRLHSVISDPWLRSLGLGGVV